MVESVAEMAGKRKSLASPNSAGKPQKKLKTEPTTPANAKNQKNTPKKTPKGKNNDQQASPANKNATEERKKFSKRKFRDFVKDAATGEVKPEEALTKIQEQINRIQSNDELSNTAKRKLLKLYSIADKIQKESGITKIDISKQKSLKPIGKIIPKAKNESKELPNAKPAKKQAEEKSDDEDGENEVDQTEEESEEEGEDGEDDSDEGEEEEDDSVEDEENSGEEEGSEEENSEEMEDEDDSDDENNEAEEKVIKKKPNEKKNTQVQVQDKEREVEDLTVFVGNIPFEATEDDVKEHFEKEIEITSVEIPKQRKDGKSRGFALMKVKDKKNYVKAISLDKLSFKGRQVYVRQYFLNPKDSPRRGPPNKNAKPKPDGKQGNQRFHPYNKGAKQGGGSNFQNRQPRQKGGFNPKNKPPNKNRN